MQDADPLIQKNIRIRASLWRRIEAAAGKRGASEFIREAIEQRLRPIEVERRLERLESRPD